MNPEADDCMLKILSFECHPARRLLFSIETCRALLQRRQEQSVQSREETAEDTFEVSMLFRHSGHLTTVRTHTHTPHQKHRTVHKATGRTSSRTVPRCQIRDGSMKMTDRSDSNNRSHRRKPAVTRLMHIDDDKRAKLMEQLAASRNQMSQKLSEANKYIAYLEHRLEDSSQAMYEAFRIMQKVIDELDALSCLTVSVAASLKFGIDADETIQKLGDLQKRLDITHHALENERSIISKNCPRRVPITWVGVAQEVRVMGDFDNWTRGQELSAEEISEHVMSEFTGTLELLPGRYEIKLLVNDEWKVTDVFPTVTHDNGVTNNVLVVE